MTKKYKCTNFNNRWQYRHYQKTEATMLMTFLNADDPRLLPETVEVPDNLVPEMRNVTYICEDLGVYIDTYPDDWLVLNGVD